MLSPSKWKHNDYLVIVAWFRLIQALMDFLVHLKLCKSPLRSLRLRTGSFRHVSVVYGEVCWEPLRKKKKKSLSVHFSIMFIRSAVWWLKTMWKTISCKQSSEIIWLVEEWYCQAPLLDIIEPLKWRSAAGYVVACFSSPSPRCDFVMRTELFRSNEHILYLPLGKKKKLYYYIYILYNHYSLRYLSFSMPCFPTKQLKCARTREGLLNLCSRFNRLVTKERGFIQRCQNVNECWEEKKKSSKCYRHLHSWEAQNVRGTSLYSVGI